MPFTSSVRGTFGPVSSKKPPEAASNYYGNGSDGSLTVTTNTSLIVPNKNGVYDGDMVVRQYSSLTINNGATLTTDQPCRGMLIYVSGNCTINGTLSMQARGPAANPTVAGASDGNSVSASGLQIPFRTATGNQTLVSSASLFNGCGTAARNVIANHPSISSNGTIITLVRQGAAGGNGTSGSGYNNGSNGTTGQTGGGGSGGNGSGTTGSGSFGSCWGGGSAGGSVHYAATAGSAAAWGGEGGFGADGSPAWGAPGGVGNPGGRAGVNSGSNNGNRSESGTGGLIILIVGGLLTIGATGKITADGVSGSPNHEATQIYGSNVRRGGAGASGGGNVVVAYKTISNSGSITANGGAGGYWTSSNPSSQRGGNGGNGSVQLLQIL